MCKCAAASCGIRRVSIKLLIAIKKSKNCLGVVGRLRVRQRVSMEQLLFRRQRDGANGRSSLISGSRIEAESVHLRPGGMIRAKALADRFFSA